MKSTVYTILTFAIAIVIWQGIVMTGEFSPALFPSPLDVAGAFGEIVSDGTLSEGITASLYRFVIGYVAAVISGVAFGLLLGTSNVLFRLANPVIQLLRPIAPVASLNLVRTYSTWPLSASAPYCSTTFSPPRSDTAQQ